MEYLESVLVDTWLNLAWNSMLYVVSIRKYLSARGIRKAAHSGMDYRLLISHILFGGVVVIRYQYRRFKEQDHSPMPTWIDLAAGLFNAGASWFLARNRIPGNPRVSRTTFQALAVLIATAVSLSSFWTWWARNDFRTLPVLSLVPALFSSETAAASSAQWYRAFVKMHMAFGYVRLIGMLNMAKTFKDHNETFSTAVFTGCLFAAIDALGRVGGGLMLGLIAGLNTIEQAASARITPENSLKVLPRLALAVGLVDLSTYTDLRSAAREKQKHDKPEEGDSEEPTEKTGQENEQAERKGQEAQ